MTELPEGVQVFICSGALVTVVPDATDYTTYDRGALCEEIDGVLGDQIERLMHRYMPKSAAKEERHEATKHFADRIIARDKSGSNPSQA
jgi:hypothetical protein